MLKLPDLDKNAHLYILVTKSQIYAHLAYADYTIGRSYVLTDATAVSSVDRLYSGSFWKDYFEALESLFNWDVFRGGSTDRMNFQAEGIGVTGVSVVIVDRLMSSHSLISAIREFSQDIKIRVTGQNHTREMMESVAQKLGYDDVLLLDLNLMDFTIHRVKNKLGKKTLATPVGKDSVFSEGKTRWTDKIKLMQAIKSARLKAFLTVDSPARKIANLWANFVLLQPSVSGSEAVADLVRAYTTVQLLTIGNENEGKFNDIGELVDGTAIFVIGDLLNLLPSNLLVMSILDGLEVRGGVDMFVDRDGLFYTLGKNYAEGVKTEEFVASPPDIFKEVYKVYVPEIDGKKGERKVIFSGSIDSESGRDQEIFAVAPEFTQIPLDFEEKRLSIDGNLIKGAYIDKYGEDISFISNPNKVKYKSLVIDGRYKPVIYGPDPKSNRDKLVEWFNEGTW